MKNVAPRDLYERTMRAGEFAIIDVREAAPFSRGHLLLASNLSLGSLELRVAELVPKRETELYLCDGGDGEGLAERAAARLASFAYENISVLEGGVAAWDQAGLEVFTGVNVPSKAFGEFIEHTNATPSITAAELHQRLARGEEIAIVDSRPADEHERMCIPGSVDVPGAELVYRMGDFAKDRPIVVHCAGRTRSIIGAQSLIDAGFAKVVALENGTMGWQLAGLELEHGSRRSAPAPSASAFEAALKRASDVANRYGVRSVERGDLASLAQGERTVYVLDVRTQEEFEEGHVAGARHAPGGQLVQATDEFAAVRNAVMVLCDDRAVRALMSAAWLRRLGWNDVYVLRDLGAELERGPASASPLGFVPAPTLSVVELEKLQAHEVAILDLATSAAHARGHIPGAYWGLRSRLQESLAAVPSAPTLVITSPDGLLAHYAAHEVERREVRVLDGGTRAWSASGRELQQGRDRLTCPADDSWRPAFLDPEAALESMREYLRWETALPAQMERDRSLRFAR